ncbi:Acetylornithine/succinyldiaminopimelate/putrescine aminotransferase [Reichenbachiella faecimaris]|uniref:Acetylornithine/succinyldiaminopimelate/putrescine aminotransferase n=1 Tax=Reichenbachiella faecimaris TaxID=692418 RepID=A0A1W2GR68_REIFA|nr:aspartate aminotransferase family protein [Reichenbachiella faecimaris]SMD38912.1 Acetylornithine/succinyldiaminopimelate/putrescine aminotransferase [Reichenbachiella faecimaris]
MNNRQLFLKHLGQTSEFPLSLEIEKAEGLYMYDKDNKAYLDLISGIGVSSIGHRHPKVIEAIKEQLDKHLHVMVYGEFVTASQVQLAHAISETLPDHLDNIFLVNSGSEATEGALKLAKRHTGRSKIVSFENAYHGSTSGALSIAGDEKLKEPFRPLLPDIHQIRFGESSDIDCIDRDTAAVIIETVQGEAGVRHASSEYFESLRAKCTETGALLIMDEIQCGFGRTGKFWAFEHYGVSPDILLCAKGMGGGMPIGGFVSSKSIMHDLTHDPVLGHITTFGGHPVSAAASLATVKVLLEEKLIETVEEKEKLFLTLLKHKKIKEVRSMGLMMAVEFESFEYLDQLIHKLLKEGILTDWFLFCDNSMRIAPPLTITFEEIKMACNKILQAIDHLD